MPSTKHEFQKHAASLAQSSSLKCRRDSESMRESTHPYRPMILPMLLLPHNRRKTDAEESGGTTTTAVAVGAGIVHDFSVPQDAVCAAAGYSNTKVPVPRRPQR